MRCHALILAAGRGARMGAERPKQFLTLRGRPLLAWTVEAFCRCPAIDGVTVAVAAQALDATRALLAAQGLAQGVALCAGGAERFDSVRAGLAALPSDAELVAIHDGARALVTPQLITRVVQAAAAAGAAIPCLPAGDTVKECSADGSTVARTHDRRMLRLAQTPQVFSVELARRAHALLAGPNPPAGPITDDAQLVEALGLPVRLVEGDPRNIKITVPQDLAIAAALLGEEQSMALPRCGVGYDVHRFDVGDAVILGGVSIPFDRRLVGHSDADVLSHAICDALLGAAALGDIGHHFPPGDPRYAGARSLDLLATVVALVAEAGYRPGNIDAVVVCEAPRLAPHLSEIRHNLAEVLELPLDRVSVKATTSEGLGFTGRAEGIAAHATAMIG